MGGDGAMAWQPVLPAPRRERPVLSWLLGLAGVVLVGVVVALVTYQLARPKGGEGRSDEGWADLSAGLLSLAVGTLALVVAWCVLLTVYVRAYLPAGVRLTAAGASVGVVLAASLGLAVVTVLLSSLGQAVTGGGNGWAALGAVWGAELAGAAAPPAMVDRYRRRQHGSR